MRRATARPVLELEATRLSYGKVDGSVFDVTPPADAKVTDLTRKTAAPAAGGTEPKPVTGAAAVAAAVPFTLSAPATLAGLQRAEVRLVHAGDHPAALVTYGAGLGGIAVLEQTADPGSGGAPAKPKEGESGLSLPTVSINGATAQELDNAAGDDRALHARGRRVHGDRIGAGGRGRSGSAWALSPAGRRSRSAGSSSATGTSSRSTTST